MAMDTGYDVVIIGTGAGGGTLAHRLAPSGKRILLLERGGYLPRGRENRSSRLHPGGEAAPRARTVRFGPYEAVSGLTSGWLHRQP
jgi:choline dehydrogenase-like flavoprotein